MRVTRKGRPNSATYCNVVLGRLVRCVNKPYLNIRTFVNLIELFVKPMSSATSRAQNLSVDSKYSISASLSDNIEFERDVLA